MCKAMDAKYAALSNALPGIKLSSLCPTSVSGRSRIASPTRAVPTIRPRPECKGVLFPGQIDDITWTARICNAALCPSAS
jgi:hypothetical protein